MAWGSRHRHESFAGFLLPARRVKCSSSWVFHKGRSCIRRVKCGRTSAWRRPSPPAAACSPPPSSALRSRCPQPEEEYLESGQQRRLEYLTSDRLELISSSNLALSSASMVLLSSSLGIRRRVNTCSHLVENLSFTP